MTDKSEPSDEEIKAIVGIPNHRVYYCDDCGGYVPNYAEHNADHSMHAITTYKYNDVAKAIHHFVKLAQENERKRTLKEMFETPMESMKTDRIHDTLFALSAQLEIRREANPIEQRGIEKGIDALAKELHYPYWKNADCLRETFIRADNGKPYHVLKISDEMLAKIVERTKAIASARKTEKGG